MFAVNNNKRLINEQKKIEAARSSHWYVTSLKDNLYEWHFTLRGVKGSDYEGGLYHGKILLPEEYPFKAPDMVFLTKSGRFETGKNICLSVTSYHNEQWTPAWNVIAILEAVGAFFLVEEAGIGYVKADSATRKKFAVESRNFKCDACQQCGPVVEKILLENEKLEQIPRSAATQPQQPQPTQAIPQNQFGAPAQNQAPPKQ